MQYRVLGPLEVLDDGVPIDIGSRQQRALLGLLLMNVNRSVSTERILDEFWADDLDGKEKTLWVYISRLRGVLEPDRKARSKSDVLVTRDHGYSLQVDPANIDAHRFEQAVELGRRHVKDDPPTAAKLLREALGLWRGDAFEDFAYDEFAQAEIARLEGLRLVATEDRIDADLRSGLHRDVIGELDKLVRDHPLRERPVGLLMIALYRSGRQADALRTFQHHRRTIGEELGLEPSPELGRIEEQVLLHDPRLNPAGGSAAPSDPAGLQNPFKGLHAFSEADVATFFGRDRLITEIVRRLSKGNRLLALVGASGSGKSSVLRAGLVPAVRKGALGNPDHWLVAQMVPGARPFTELESALLRSTLDSPDSLADLLNHREEGLLRAGLRLLPEPSGRILLVIDQFEELFTLVESAEERGRFIRNLEVALGDPHGRIVVAVALRADFYDRPLEYPDFANMIGDGVVNIVPLSPDELEAAAEEPAARAGVHIEPTLLARLLTDVAGQSGGLPIFQYALTELFDRRTGTLLTADVYEEMGGVRGAITRRAEDIFNDLDPGEQAASKQLFLRLVTIANAGAWSRRRVAASEIVTIAVDVVDLQTVLNRFGAHRLLTFDRDFVTGSSTVEVAHEALLYEWARLREWIEEGRADVLHHARLVTALNEWRAAAENPDYLLSGERLAAYEDWARGSTLRLSTDERQYLDAAIEQREIQGRVEAQRTERETKLGRQARTRLRGLAVGGALLIILIGGILIATLSGDPPRIVVLHKATGDAVGVNDLMVSGAVTAEGKFDIPIERLQLLVLPEETLRQLAETGADLIVVSGDFDNEVQLVAPDFPDVHFVAIDATALHIERPNITKIHFAVEESAFLAGAAAALTTDTRVVGFIGGLQTFPVESSRTGFEQGVAYENSLKSADQSVTVISRYLGPVPDPWATATSQPALAMQLARTMYEEGADIIFHDAGPSGTGVIAAARDMSDSGHLWVIGSDTDEYLTTASGIDREHVLSSAIKRYDSAVIDSIGAFLDDRLAPGDVTLGLAQDGVDLSREGGHLAPIDGHLKNLDGDLAFEHANVHAHSLVGPQFQHEADLTIQLEMTDTSCVADVSGGLPEGNRVRVERGSVVVFDYVNRTDSIGGLSLRTIAPGVSIPQLAEEAKLGIPTSYEAILGLSLIEPGARTRVAAVMAGSAFVPNCYLWESTEEPANFPVLIVSPGT